MRVNCYYCVNHRQQGAKHTCTKCKNKIIYGVMQEKFLKPCMFYKMTLEEYIKRDSEKRQAEIPEK